MEIHEAEYRTDEALRELRGITDNEQAMGFILLGEVIVLALREHAVRVTTPRYKT